VEAVTKEKRVSEIARQPQKKVYGPEERAAGPINNGLVRRLGRDKIRLTTLFRSRRRVHKGG